MGQVYDPVINKKEYNFDSAGLRGGAPTLKDRETSSVWSLATGEAIEGSLKGTRMTRIPSWIITWKRFSELHPDAYVLKEDAQQSPHYVTRSTAPTCPLPGAMKQSTTGRIDKRLPVDTLIFGVSGSDGPTALALAALTKSKGVVYDKGTVIFYDENGKAAGAYVPKAKGKQLRFTVMDKDGARIFRDAETQSTWTIEGSAIDGPLKGEILTSVSSCRSRWFAWSAAFPKTEIVRKAK
jgi:hypothetical protein